MVTKQAKRLNDLTGKEWLVHTKTVMLGDCDRAAVRAVEDAIEAGVMFSQAPPRDLLKKSHPATFSEKDVGKLIRFFTKSEGLVLDPFMGVGSTAIACMAEGRQCIGLELYQNWVDIATQRVNEYNSALQRDDIPLPDLRCIEALDGMASIDNESVDFIVTSPPYWNVLNKVDHKARQERVQKELESKYGENTQDLANVAEYAVFLRCLREHFTEYARLLKPRKYAAVVVSDFRHGNRHYLFHAHVAEQMEMAGFITQSVVNLVQDNKRLYPYGYPTTLVPNVSNQYIVIGRKL
jgi:DNA modification methylase